MLVLLVFTLRNKDMYSILPPVFFFSTDSCLLVSEQMKTKTAEVPKAGTTEVGAMVQTNCQKCFLSATKYTLSIR